MKVTLVGLPNSNDPQFSGSAFIDKPRFSIGRAENNDWVLNDPKREISKHHCIIEVNSGSCRVIDRSTNGTSVSGRPVDPDNGQVLRNGDEIELGRYRFRIDVVGLPKVDEIDPYAENTGAPAITSILHDVAEQGVAADGPLAGDSGDAFDATPNISQASGAPIGGDIGWDGPPQGDPELVQPEHLKPLQSNELSDRLEQAGTDKQLIDLPTPAETVSNEPSPAAVDAAPILPENWMDDEAAEEPEATPPVAPQTPGSVAEPALKSTPVENIDVGVVTTPATPAPSVQRTNEAHEALQAFFDGLGVDQELLAHADPVRLMHNAGRALAITGSSLQNLQIERVQSSKRLHTAEGETGKTPWIFSLSGEDQTQVVAALASFLADAEPRDVGAMAEDFSDVEQFLKQLSTAMIGFVETVESSLSVSDLRKNTSTASNALTSLKKAALWDALLDHSGLYKRKSKTDAKADLLPLLENALKNAKDRNK